LREILDAKTFGYGLVCFLYKKGGEKFVLPRQKRHSGEGGGVYKKTVTADVRLVPVVLGNRRYIQGQQHSWKEIRQ